MGTHDFLRAGLPQAACLLDQGFVDPKEPRGHRSGRSLYNSLQFLTGRDFSVTGSSVYEEIQHRFLPPLQPPRRPWPSPGEPEYVEPAGDDGGREESIGRGHLGVYPLLRLFHLSFVYPLVSTQFLLRTFASSLSGPWRTGRHGVSYRPTPPSRVRPLSVASSAPRSVSTICTAWDSLRTNGGDIAITSPGRGRKSTPRCTASRTTRRPIA